MAGELAGRRVLVTGAGGFLGSHLVAALVERGARVTAVLRPGGDRARLRGVDGIDALVAADVLDAGALRAVVRQADPEIAYHLANVTSIRARPGDWSALRTGVDVNLVGTLNLLEALATEGASLSRFVRAGGLEEYGRAATPYREEQREQPVSAYSASQVATTHYCQMLQAELPFDVVTLRPALVYGPGQSAAFFIPAAILSLLAGRPFDMTSGEQARDLVYVDDAMEAFLAAGVREGLRGRVINVGCGREYAMRDVGRSIRRITGSAAPINAGGRAPRASDLAHLVADSRLAAELLGWRATTSLEEGLARTVAWYARQEAASAAPPADG